jgi:hypothetical protein
MAKVNKSKGGRIRLYFEIKTSLDAEGMAMYALRRLLSEDNSLKLALKLKKKAFLEKASEGLLSFGESDLPYDSLYYSGITQNDINQVIAHVKKLFPGLE